jgi:hypothetical protein
MPPVIADFDARYVTSHPAVEGGIGATRASAPCPVPAGHDERVAIEQRFADNLSAILAADTCSYELRAEPVVPDGGVGNDLKWT